MNIGIDFTGIAIVFFCHDGKGNVLMSKRSIHARDEHGRWDIGGGKLEAHSTVEETLRKEIQEEYCADIIQYDFLGYRDVHREQNNIQTHWIALDFKVLIDKEQFKNGEPDKFDDVQWFAMDQLPTPIHSQLPIFLKKYSKQLHSHS